MDTYDYTSHILGKDIVINFTRQLPAWDINDRTANQFWIDVFFFFRRRACSGCFFRCIGVRNGFGCFLSLSGLQIGNRSWENEKRNDTDKKDQENNGFYPFSHTETFYRKKNEKAKLNA